MKLKPCLRNELQNNGRRNVANILMFLCRTSSDFLSPLPMGISFRPNHKFNPMKQLYGFILVVFISCVNLEKTTQSHNYLSYLVKKGRFSLISIFLSKYQHFVYCYAHEKPLYSVKINTSIKDEFASIALIYIPFGNVEVLNHLLGSTLRLFYMETDKIEQFI